MNRLPDLMFPFVGGKRRLKGIVFVLVSSVILLNTLVGAVTVSPVLLVPGLLVGIPFLSMGLDCLRPSVLFVREIDILVAWSRRSHKQWHLQGLRHGQATRDRVRLTYAADPRLPLELTLEACDFTPASWWPLVSAIRDRSRAMNPGMTFSLVDDLVTLPAVTDDEFAAFAHAAGPGGE